MNHRIMFLASLVTLILFANNCYALDVVTDFNTGDTLTATGMTEIKDAVNSKQNRVSNTCAVGSSIRAINADGTVICEVDSNSGGDITAVTTATGSGLAGGVTSGAANLSLASGYVSVSPAAFMSKYINDVYCYSFTTFVEQYFASSSTVSNCGSVAAVNLPHNADISSIQCYVRDSHSTEDVSIIFRRTTLSTASATVLATLTTAGANTTATLSRSSSFTSHTVNNATYSYTIEFNPGNTTTVSSNHRIFGCYIPYSY